MFKTALLLACVVTAYAAPTTSQACSDVTVIFARGTSEAAPIGSVVGPPFQTALRTALGSRSLSFQGVNYAATVGGFLMGGDRLGAATMAQNVASTATSCPNTKIVMSGYSQGGQLVHLAAQQLTPSVQARVSAIVIFGDPDNGQPFPGNLNAVEKTFCAVGDLICAGTSIVLPAHLSYGQNAGAAASFVVATI